MFLRVPNVLAPDEIRTVREIAATARFVDGRISNPHNTSKANLQTDPSDSGAQHASQIAIQALKRCESARNFIFLKRMAQPMLARYEPGMKYGPHTDAAFLPVGPTPLRSDISCTIFIAEPGEYQGGELVIHLGTESVSLKSEPGSAVFYPSTTLHEVTPVSAGARLVMITFIESQIADQQQREMLYQLNEVYALEGRKMEWNNCVRLHHVSQSLFRKWAS
jgi:PKHD-type hydroxylase